MEKKKHYEKANHGYGFVTAENLLNNNLQMEAYKINVITNKIPLKSSNIVFKCNL